MLYKKVEETMFLCFKESEGCAVFQENAGCNV
jgi:hypothetical protein